MDDGLLEPLALDYNGIAQFERYGYVKEYLADHEFPVWGICVGAQFIALNSGGEVGPGTHPEYGKTAVTFFNKGV